MKQKNPVDVFGCPCYTLNMTSKYETLIQIFVEMPVFTASEARAAGIP
ncbi:MAG: hypothetical protein K1000chlam3_00870, partial [Chlamydiae bacterium]|nr:hypothetical protein [Chlamydiota bacterium]